MYKLLLLVVALCALATYARIESFSWKNCGSDSDPVKLEQLTISPDPAKFDSNITLSVKGDIGVTVSNTSSYKAEVIIRKKVLGVFIDIPCISNIGTCTYDDFCSLFHPKDGQCDGVLKEYKVPCQCPFTAGTYTIPASQVYVKDPGYDWLVGGDYEVQGSLFDPAGKRLACYFITLTIA